MLVSPQDLPGAERLFDIDTLDGAWRLTQHLRDREHRHTFEIDQTPLTLRPGRRWRRMCDGPFHDPVAQMFLQTVKAHMIG